jgi:hypothetical protein
LTEAAIAVVRSTTLGFARTFDAERVSAGPGPAHTINTCNAVDAVGQREWLRAEWKRLTRQREALLAETVRIRALRDATALRAHAERLARHKEELVAFGDVLHAHHARYGPVGWLSTDM